ncbi:hypothetical protein BV20DRAFT_945383, partial [Pilatotrama ljubarskyi]
MTGSTDASAPAAEGQETSSASAVAAQGTTAPARSSQSTRLYDIDKLDNKGSNFTVWKYRISRILIQRGLWSLVFGKEPAP